MFRLVLFGLASAGIACLSGQSLRDRRSHGFFRFFAFESILALTLINLKRWFADPFSAHQLVSWKLLFASAALAAHGFGLLRRTGRPEGRIENTTVLVKEGVYRYIRHPLYGSLLWLAWGVFFKAPSALGGLLAMLASASLVATARVEESENLARFGEEYAEYVKSTRMFVPFLF